MEFQFFAEMSEQAQWLADLGSETDYWFAVGWHNCSMYLGGAAGTSAALAAAVRTDDRGSGWIRVHIGIREITPSPVTWRVDRNDGTVVHIIESSASGSFDFDPSVTLADGSVLSGSIGAPSAARYDAHGLDGARIHSWYKRFVRRFRRDLGCRHKTLCRHIEDQPIRWSPSFIKASMKIAHESARDRPMYQGSKSLVVFKLAD